MNIELIIFDCDGVLVDSETIANRVFVEEALKLGVSISTEEAVEKFTGTSMSECIAYVETMLGDTVPDNFLQTYRERSFEAFRQELQPVKGIKSVLNQLQLPFCVASNGPRDKIELNLKLTGLSDYFANRIFTAYEIGKYKPDPHFYLTVAEQMNTPPSLCVVVEDSMAGVKAAKGAGMKVFAYTENSSHSAQLLSEAGALPFSNMIDLPELLFG